MGVSLHLHLIAAISWIGGSVLLFVLGIALRNKQDQKEVYSRIGPIYGVITSYSIHYTKLYDLSSDIYSKMNLNNWLQSMKVFNGTKKRNDKGFHLRVV